MTKIPSSKFSINQFVRQNSRLLLLLLGATIFSCLWVVQQNNVNRLNSRIISLKNSIGLAEEESKNGMARDQSFTVEKRLGMEKDILVIEKDKVAIQNGVYTTLVQALGGIILSITAYVGYCNFRVGEKNLKVTEDKQVTERFSKSIEHLGSDKIDIRFSEANFANTKLIGTNLSNAQLSAHYQYENKQDDYFDEHYEEEQTPPDWNNPPSLSGALMIDTQLNGAQLSGTDLSNTRGLTQQQLNSAHTDNRTKLPNHLNL